MPRLTTLLPLLLTYSKRSKNARRTRPVIHAALYEQAKAKAVTRAADLL